MTSTTGEEQRPSAVRKQPSCLDPYPDRIEHFLRKHLFGLNLEGISPGVEYQLESGGKRLRPALALWFGDRLGVPLDPIEPFAAAVELLHNVFLIQDDIQDGDTFRRGQPTLWRHCGVDQAINVADFLLAEAYRWMLAPDLAVDPGRRTSILAAFTTTFRMTVEGQALDLAGRAAPDLDLERYDELVRKKTGCYLALTWVGAALIAGRSEREVEPLWRVGDHLGPAFQMWDDVLDLSPGKGRGGERGCDIREGKPSILFAHTMSAPSVTAEEKARTLETLRTPRESTSDRDVEWVIELYHRCGAVESATSDACRRAEDGIATFAKIDFVSAKAAAEFREIAEFVVNRRV